VAPTQDALYADIDLALSWSERDLPERERTKHVHRLHPYLGKFIPQLVEILLARYFRPGQHVLDPFAGSGTTLVQALESGLDATGVDGTVRDYNVSWHDWLNLKSLIAVSRVIATAALAREDSRGAHFREDFPDTSDLTTSRYTVARLAEDGLAITTEPVHFTRVSPGETLLREAAE